jgi:hypothetical protein
MQPRLRCHRMLGQLGATDMMGRQQDDQAKLFYEFSRRPNLTGLLPQRTHCYVRRPVDLATRRRA